MSETLIAASMAAQLVVIAGLLVALHFNRREHHRERCDWWNHEERWARAVLAKHAGEYDALEKSHAVTEMRVDSARADRTRREAQARRSMPDYPPAATEGTIPDDLAALIANAES